MAVLTPRVYNFKGDKRPENFEIIRAITTVHTTHVWMRNKSNGPRNPATADYNGLNIFLPWEGE